MFNLKGKIVTSTLTYCLFSVAAFGGSDITRLTKKQGLKLHKKHQKLQKENFVNKMKQNKNKISSLAKMALDISKEMNVVLTKSEPKLMEALKNKFEKIR